MLPKSQLWLKDEFICFWSRFAASLGLFSMNPRLLEWRRADLWSLGNWFQILVHLGLYFRWKVSAACCSKTPERRLIFGTELYHWSLITFWRSAFDVPAAFSSSPFQIFLDLILIWIRVCWHDLFCTDYWLIILHNCILTHNRPMGTVELTDFWAAFSTYSIFRCTTWAHRPTVSF